MKKILIVSYYQLKESLMNAAYALQQLGYDICNYPLFQYAYDKNDKRPDYLQHFLEYIADSECDIILWWFFGISATEIQHIRCKTTDKYHVLYNWDDPYCWRAQKEEFGNKCRNFDLVISSCLDTTNNYYQFGVKKVVYGLPGYTETASSNNAEIEYQADVSFCVINLYESGENQFINRKKLIDLLAAERDIRFHLYGSEYLRELYPMCYQGYVKYDDLNNIFKTSKINISTHVVCNSAGYVNERSIQILACGGLLLVDKVKDFPFKSCVVIDATDPIKQIKEILANYDNFAKMKEEGRQEVSEYKWENWAGKLHMEFAHHFFNYKFYKQIYQLSKMNDAGELWKHWQENPHNVYDEMKIPRRFNAKRYATDKGLDCEERLLYWHWKTIGQEDIKYIMKKNANTNAKQIALIPTEQYRLFALFSKLHERGNAEKYLGEIDKIVRTSPYLNLKDCLDSYFDSQN